MKTFTIDDIRLWAPCYDPTRYLPADWRGTALDILAVKDCPAEDRLWVVLRQECTDKCTLRLFAVWCARQALALIDDPDQRSIAALDTAERFANGEATVNGLAAAGAAARDASADAWNAWNARAAAEAAAGAAAGAAARDAAGAAARDAAGAASGAAAWDAASGAAWAAARAANAAVRAAARDAAWDAVRAAARAAQVGHLHEMLLVTDAAQF